MRAAAAARKHGCSNHGGRRAGRVVSRTLAASKRLPGAGDYGQNALHNSGQRACQLKNCDKQQQRHCTGRAGLQVENAAAGLDQRAPCKVSMPIGRQRTCTDIGCAKLQPPSLFRVHTFWQHGTCIWKGGKLLPAGRASDLHRCTSKGCGAKLIFDCTIIVSANWHVQDSPVYTPRAQASHPTGRPSPAPCRKLHLAESAWRAHGKSG